jgi:RND family efflux transporter MFP subunit
MSSVSRKPLIAVAVVVVVAAGFWLWSSRSHKTVAVAGAVPVRVVEVVRRDVPDVIRAVGTVRSQRSVLIRPQVDGELLELLVREGQQVKRGDLLVRIDDRAIVAALDQAKAQLAVSEAQLKSATLDLDRYRSLQKDHVISVQVLDQQSATVEQLAASVRTNQAAVAARQVQLSYTRIYSPTDGRVGIRNYDPGSQLRAADTVGLFYVTQLDPISVEISLPQAILPKLQGLLRDASGTAAPVLAYDSEGGELLGTGHLALIDNRVTAATGTIRVKAEFANPQGRLWPDQSVTVTVQSKLLRDALVVPQTVVQRGLDNTFVYRLKDDKAEVVNVELAYSDNDIAVLTGVEAGDRVVLDGQSRLRPGSKVRVLDPTKTQASKPAAGIAAQSAEGSAP